MTQKIGVNIEDLKELAAVARRNHTEQACLILAIEWAEKANAEIVRLHTAMEHIAATTGSDDPCRKFVDIAREALRAGV